MAAAWALGDFAARPPGRAGKEHCLLRVQTALGLPSWATGPQEESVSGQAGPRWGGLGGREQSCWGHAGSPQPRELLLRRWARGLLHVGERPSHSAADWKLQMSVLQPELALGTSRVCQSDRSSCPPGPESSRGCPGATWMGHLKSVGRGRV